MKITDFLHDAPPNGFYNFVTRHYVPQLPETDEEAKCYILQDEAAIGLYELYRAQGATIPDALVKVWLACVAA